MGIRSDTTGMNHMREGSSPHTQGAIPRRTVLQGALGVLGTLAVGQFGCSTDPRDPRTYGPHVVAMKSDTPAAFAGEEVSVFQVKRSIPLPIGDTPPGRPRIEPYPGPVWITPEKFRVQCSCVVTNLEDRELDLELLVDGWNEFIFYSPQVRVVDEDVVPDRSCVQRSILLPAKARVENRISYDDFERMAIALAAAPRAPNSGHLMDPTTNLNESVLAKPYVPHVISGITGFDLSIRIRGDAPARVAVEATVEVIDLAGFLMNEGDEGNSPNRRARDRGRREFLPVLVAEEG